MRNQCLDEGMIQSYLDGELSPNLMEKTAAHLAACDACALALSEAQEELDIFSVAFEHELSIPVPTEILREKLNLAIAAERQNQNFAEPNRSRFSTRLSTLTSSFIFKPQFATGFAILLVAVLVGVIFLVPRQGEGGLNDIAGFGRPSDFPPLIWTAPTPTPEVVKEPGSKVRNKKIIKGSDNRPKTNLPLSGEKSYLQAIASLEKAIDVQDDLSTRPSLLAEYQRSLAVVDKAINETQKQARKNPKDTGAAQLLYASYQSKIDLLNTVSSQNQLYASLR